MVAPGSSAGNLALQGQVVQEVFGKMGTVRPAS